MPSPSPISALTVQPARSTVGAALRPLPGFGVNRDFFFLVVSQYPVSIDSYPIKHRGHAGLSLGLMSPLFDGEPVSEAVSVSGLESAARRPWARRYDAASYRNSAACFPAKSLQVAAFLPVMGSKLSKTS